MNGVETVGKDAWGAVQQVAPLVPDIASIAGKIARRQPESGWDKFKNGVETVGKDALNIGEKVAPIVGPLMSLAARDPEIGRASV